MVFARAAMVLAAVVLATLATAQATPAPTYPGLSGRPLRIVCDGGQPPFNYIENGECRGVLITALTDALTRVSMPYNITAIPDGSKKKLLAVNATTGLSQFDVMSSFTTIATNKYDDYNFLITMDQVDYTAVLLPKYQKAGGSLTGSVLRASVMYLLTVLLLFVFGFAMLILAFESRSPDSEMMADCDGWGRRILYALENAVEVMLTSGCSGAISSHALRAMRTLFAFCGLFLINILAAVITSQLTAASLSAGQPEKKDFRGLRIASSGSVLGPYIESTEVGAVRVIVPSMLQTAVDFYGANPLNLDGYVTNTPVLKYLHGTYGVGKGVMSKPFRLSSRALENKAMPASYGLDVRVHSAINAALDALRKDGTLASLIESAVPEVEITPVDDIPVDSTAYTATSVLCIVLYVATFAVVVALVFHNMAKKSSTTDDDNNEETRSPTTGVVAAGATLTWRGQTYTVPADGSEQAVLDAIAKGLPLASPSESACVPTKPV